MDWAVDVTGLTIITVTCHQGHGLSRRCDRSHYHHCDLSSRSWTEPSMWPVSLSSLWLVVGKKPDCERHIRCRTSTSQQDKIKHSELLLDGGPDLCRSHLDSNFWMCRTSNSSTADLHVDHQSVPSLANDSSWEGVTPHWFNVVFRQSVKVAVCDYR